MASLLVVPVAHGADRIYFSNYDGKSVGWANLNDDGGNGIVNAPAASFAGPMGLAIDPSRGLIYWTNWKGDTGTTISYAHLDGSGGGDLNITGATIDGPHGLAIDPNAGPYGTLYWPNHAANSISWAQLDGAGGGAGDDFTIPPDVTIDGPRGMMIDPVTHRLYWSNFAEGLGMTISYVNLNGSGGGDFVNLGVTDGPEGTAIDPATRKIYWSDYGQKHLIQYADSDGTHVSTLAHQGAATSGVHGVAIDTDTQRIYWANYGTSGIGWAKLDGSGGGNLNVATATIWGPNLPALLKKPAAASAPTVSGGSEPGASLSCSPGTWAGDELEALLYRAPQAGSFSYRWTLDGANLPGATGTSITAGAEGNYRCLMTAANAAGSTTQASAPHKVGTTPPPPPSNDFSFGELKRNRAHGTAKLAVVLPGSGDVVIAGSHLQPFSKHPTAQGETLLKVKPLGKTKRKLLRRGKASVRPKVTFTPTGGTANMQSERVKLVEKRKR